jgi:hypothetical protein
MDRIEARQDRVDPRAVPRRRPACSREVLEGEDRSDAVVVPSQEPGEERLAVEQLVGPLLSRSQSPVSSNAAILRNALDPSGSSTTKRRLDGAA